MTPKQSFVQRFLQVVDTSEAPSVTHFGLLGFIEQIETLLGEGITRGFVNIAGQSTATNLPVDSDFTAAGYTMTAIQFANLATQLQYLMTTLNYQTNGISTLTSLYGARQ